MRKLTWSTLNIEKAAVTHHRVAAAVRFVCTPSRGRTGTGFPIGV